VTGLENPGVCQCCEFETSDLESYNLSHGFGERRDRWLCEVCASTHASSWMKWRVPEQYDDSYRKLAQQAAWSTNYVVAELARIVGERDAKTAGQLELLMDLREYFRGYGDDENGPHPFVDRIDAALRVGR